MRGSSCLAVSFSKALFVSDRLLTRPSIVDANDFSLGGFPFSFGVFQSHYIAITFAADPSSVPTIGTCATGIMYMLSPFMMYVLEEYPSTRKSCAVVGLVIMIASLLAASFAREVWQLILCQGVVFGVGGMALYEPTCFYLNEWFVKKKGMAFGVMWSGSVDPSHDVFLSLLTDAL